MTVNSIPGYSITPLSDGKYAVAVNNGNLGARVYTRDEMQAFFDRHQSPRQKYDFFNPYEIKIHPEDSFLEKFSKNFNNIYKLKHTEGLSGLELLQAKLHNCGAATINPFAWCELMSSQFRL